MFEKPKTISLYLEFQTQSCLNEKVLLEKGVYILVAEWVSFLKLNGNVRSRVKC